jgi:ribosomal-protein-alanine N-acetyltransferase
MFDKNANPNPQFGIVRDGKQAAVSQRLTPPVIETDRLIFRQFNASDLPDFTDLYTDCEVMQFIGKGARTPAEAEKELMEFIQHWQRYGFGPCAVIEKASNRLIGRSGLRVSARSPYAEFGYVLFQPFWGKGLGTEAAKACLRMGFTHLELPHIVAFAQQLNFPSQHILLHKLGMYCEQRFELSQIKYIQFGLSRDSYFSSNRHI